VRLVRRFATKREKSTMRAILLAIALIAGLGSTALAAWGDSPLCASSIRETRAATRDFYTYYGQVDAQVAEALMRLRTARQLVEPSRAACRGAHEQVALAFHARELAQIEADIRARAKVRVAELSPVVSSR
jgi:hypothetical protein